MLNISICIHTFCIYHGIPQTTGSFALLTLFASLFFASLAPQDFEGHSRLQKELLTAAIDMVDAGACETWDEGRL